VNPEAFEPARGETTQARETKSTLTIVSVTPGGVKTDRFLSFMRSASFATFARAFPTLFMQTEQTPCGEGITMAGGTPLRSKETEGNNQ
jgi:hypothetical protein